MFSLRALNISHPQCFILKEYQENFISIQKATVFSSNKKYNTVFEVCYDVGIIFQFNLLSTNKT